MSRLARVIPPLLCCLMGCDPGHFSKTYVRLRPERELKTGTALMAPTVEDVTRAIDDVAKDFEFIKEPVPPADRQTGFTSVYRLRYERRPNQWNDLTISIGRGDDSGAVVVQLAEYVTTRQTEKGRQVEAALRQQLREHFASAVTTRSDAPAKR
jgi:hypothetical protein